MPRQVQDDRPYTLGWVGSLEEIEQLQLTLGNEVVEESWGGPSRPWFDWQKRFLTCTADEIGMFGGKSSGKSQSLRAWLVSGNPTEPDEDEDGNINLVNKSYIYHPDYLGLILRRNEKDLTDFLIRAQKMYSPLGGEYVNGFFRFPAYTKDGMRTNQLGARIDCGHMKDASSWQKYIGTEYQRVAIDEAPLIPEYSLIEELRSCMRTPHKNMRIQLAYAGNAGGPGTCVPYGDVLTPTGWIPIQNIKVGDFVYSIDDHRNMIIKQTEQVHHINYEGLMRHVCGRGFNMTCTPDHKIPYSPRSENVPYHDYYKLTEFDNLPHQAKIIRSVNWVGTPISGIDLTNMEGRNESKQPLKLDPKQSMTLLGWFLSEGFTLHRRGRVEKVFGIVQGKIPHKQILKSFLEDDCKFKIRWQSREGADCAYIASSEWWSYLSQFGKAREKYIPQFAKLATKEQLSWLLDALMLGDGSWGSSGSRRNNYPKIKHKLSGTYYTSSKQMADDVSEICVKLGFVVHISTRFKNATATIRVRDIKANGPAYEVNFKKVEGGCLEVLTGNIKNKMSNPGNRPRMSDVSSSYYTGTVYCLGIPDTHTFIIRQNGSVWVSGNCWVIDRFMRARDKSGKVIPHDNIITEEYTHPFTGEKVNRTRIWLFATIADNIVMRDTAYAVTLMSLTDPKMRAAYYEGRWDALFGSYFSDLFRPEGPQANEPSTACHVIFKNKETKTYPKELRPWWPISMGGDWAYSPHDAAFLWARKTPEGQVVIYDELCVSQVLPTKLGVEIAQRSKKDLELLPSHSFNLYLGHDAFAGRDGDRTIAELIAAGIAKVLGPDSVYVPDVLISKLKETWEKDALNWQDEQKRDKAIEQIKLHRRQGITIKKAEKTGIIGWQHCRESLRFEHNIATNIYYDEQIANKLLRDDPKAFEEYAKLYRNIRPEVLPKLQILDCCPLLIEAIPKAQHEDGTENISKNHFKGKDLVDCWLYLSLGIDDESPQEPFEVYRDRKISELTKLDPSITVNDLCRINMVLEDEWKKDNRSPLPCTPPRGPRARRMHKMGILKGEDRWQQIRNTTRY